MKKISPVILEIIRSGLEYSAYEMGIALRNSSFSHNIKERMDHSCAFFNKKGELIAQAEHIPVHLGSFEFGVKRLINELIKRKISIEDGDIIVCNNPYITGTHLNDITLLKPVYLKKKLLGYVANKAHHVDVGGTSGSITFDAPSLYDEGMVIEPQKLMKKGKLNKRLLSLLSNASLTPEISKGDYFAQIASLNLGEDRFFELVKRFGEKVIDLALNRIILETQKEFLTKILKFPQGKFKATDYLEEIKDKKRVKVQAKVYRNNKKIVVDFNGTDRAIKAPFNAVYGVTVAASYFAIKAVLAPDIPMNSGISKLIQVKAKKGSLVNPVFPYPCSCGNLETSQRIADVVLKALAKVFPEKVPAACYGSMNNLIVSGEIEGKKWVFYETIGGGSGARPECCGENAVQCNMTNTMNTPIEALENSYPLLFMQYSIRENSGGKGLYTGGDGIIRAFQALTDNISISLIGERGRIRPYGFEGGQPGKRTVYFVRRKNGSREILPLKCRVVLNKGDILIIKTAGGGGFGH